MNKVKNRIIIWGAGITAEYFLGYIDFNYNQVVNIVDSNKEKWGGVFCGATIISPEEISGIAYDLLIIGSVYEVEIMEQCIELGISNYIAWSDIPNLLVRYPSLFSRQGLCSLLAQNINKLDGMAKYNLENVWRNNFKDTVEGYSWYNVKSISLGRWAIGYNYAYVLARVLNSFRPRSILEFGLGQSSKIISSYVKYCKSEELIHYDVIEQDENWIDFFKKENKIPEEMSIYQRDIVKKENVLGGILYEYNDFDGIIKNKKYNLISVDGPWGGDNLSRLETYLHTPGILEKDFVIMIDDYERYGEKLMVNKLEERLKECGIKFYSGIYESVKDVYIIVSCDWQFLISL